MRETSVSVIFQPNTPCDNQLTAVQMQRDYCTLSSFQSYMMFALLFAMLFAITTIGIIIILQRFAMLFMLISFHNDYMEFNGSAADGMLRTARPRHGLQPHEQAAPTPRNDDAPAHNDLNAEGDARHRIEGVQPGSHRRRRHRVEEPFIVRLMRAIAS